MLTIYASCFQIDIANPRGNIAQWFSAHEYYAYLRYNS